MSDIQKQVEEHIRSLDTGNKVDDQRAAIVFMQAIRDNKQSISKEYAETNGYGNGGIAFRWNQERADLLNRLFQQIPQSLRESIRTGRSNLTHETKKKVGEVKMSYQQSREMARDVGRSKGTTTEQGRAGLSEYRNAILASKQFEEFNDAFSSVLEKALDGDFVEGGAAGFLKSLWNKLNGRHLKSKLEALRSIAPGTPSAEEFIRKYYLAVASRQTKLDALMRANPKNGYANRDALSWLAGYKNKGRAQEILSNPTATFLESRNRAIIDILISGLGSIGGGFDIVIGHIKTPFIKGYHPLVDKDDVGEQYFGKKGTGILEDEMYKGDKAIGKLADILKRGVNTNADMQIAQEIAETRQALEERINWSDNRVEDSLRKSKRILFGGALGSFFGQIFDGNLRRIASSINQIDQDISLGDKRNAIAIAVAGLESEQNLEIAKGKNRTIGEMVQIAAALDSARFLLSRIENHLSLGGQREAFESQKPGVKRLIGILSQYKTYDAFKQENTIDPRAESDFKKFFDGKIAAEDLYYGRTPNVQEFTRTKGTKEEAAFVAKMNQIRVDMEGSSRVEGKRKNNGYWNAENPPKDGAALEQAFRTVDVGGESLVARYTRQINQLTGFNTSPDELYSAAGRAGDPVNISALNTAFNSVEPGGRQTNNCFILRIPKTIHRRTPEGTKYIDGELIIAVKPGCTNLQVCDHVFVGEEFQETRYAGQAGVERSRFIFTYSMIRNLFRDKSRPNKDTPPEEPCDPHNPNHPKKPGPTQGYSEPETTVIQNPPVGATETPVPPTGGYTMEATLPPAGPTGTSVGGGPSTLPPPPPAPPLPPPPGTTGG